MSPKWFGTSQDQMGASRADALPGISDEHAISSELNDVLAHIDDTACNADEDADVIEATRSLSLDAPASHRRLGAGRTLVDFKKTWLYANSRLPPHLMPMRLYMSTWSIICLAAQASVDVYTPSAVANSTRTTNNARVDHVPASWRAGTKAMTIATQPVNDNNIVVVAIRGSQLTPVDWAVNFRPEPTLPTGFLDDDGNACHAGFLQVARAMARPLAERLRTMLAETPTGNRNDVPASLILTGHSAGGAVASLLFMHMQSTTADSELSYLRPFFRRIHCVTFGVPPLSLLPLQSTPRPDVKKNLFLSFANEGDPVVRADKVYLRALTSILAAPAPVVVSNKPWPFFGRSKVSFQQHAQHTDQSLSRPPYRALPPSTLSNAGRMVLLRDAPGRHAEVEAVQTSDEELRNVIFGDPAMHSMILYKRRVDRLAIKAVTSGAM